MKTIKKISGDLLLYFYERKRRRGIENDISLNFDLEFINDKDELKFEPLKDEEKDLLIISDNNFYNLYNSLQYLEEKGFISYNFFSKDGREIFYNIHVIAHGVDIIEGIERDDKEAKDNFTFNFNIKLADNINIESLIKSELSGDLSLFKLGL
ncbi:MAG: hypothetical protein KAT32_02180 [Candidatus Moranbacteria bacterium]|nr:hypothetical protein [Candidatus Moranbacteria bacterium]